MKASVVPFVLESLTLFIASECHNRCPPLHSTHYCHEKKVHQRTHFCDRRLSYYSNTVCTFQLEILRSGDVQPNPGPTAENSAVPLRSTEPTHLMCASGINGATGSSRSISYDRSELLLLNHTHGVTPNGPYA